MYGNGLKRQYIRMGLQLIHKDIFSFVVEVVGGMKKKIAEYLVATHQIIQRKQEV